MAPKRFFQITSFIVVLFYALSFGLLPASAEAMAVPDLNTFVNNVENGHSTIIRGIYAPEAFALPVIQQPKDNAAYVANTADVVTEFSMARRYGNIGMLAHNHLAGKYFSSLHLGSQIQMVYGNGKIENFIVTQVLRYQALSPNSPYTNFVDLESGKTLTVQQVFYKVYTGERHVTLQTCIAQNDEPSWGRLFVIAEPMVEVIQSETAAHYQ
jgi:hypothetical protein